MDVDSHIFTIEYVTAADGVSFRARGEIDLATAPQLGAALRRVDRVGVADLDLSEVTFCDGSGLHVLDDARRRLGDRLRVRGASPLVRKLARVVGMDWLASAPEGPEEDRRYGGEVS
jgi:anti-anti-sigma factor